MSLDQLIGILFAMAWASGAVLVAVYFGGIWFSIYILATILVVVIMVVFGAYVVALQPVGKK